MSISLKNISKSYGRQEVLKKISFDIGKGEIVGFLGPNGAGKTTTMRILAGSLGYDSGSAKVCGMEVSDFPMDTKKNIGYLPENNPLYTDMYVKEYLLFAAETMGIGKERHSRVDELIDLVGLRKEFKKKIGQLSKGYRQRVGLAQTLIHNPPVLILDEPTTGLDPNQLVEIRSLIRKIGSERTVLLSTHIMQEVEAVCNRVLIINNGTIATDYSNIDKPDHSENQFYIEVEFSNPVQSLTIPSVVSVTTTDNNRTFSIVSTDDIRESLFDFAVAEKNKIRSLSLQEKKIETIFQEATKLKEL